MRPRRRCIQGDRIRSWSSDCWASERRRLKQGGKEGKESDLGLKSDAERVHESTYIGLRKTRRDQHRMSEGRQRNGRTLLAPAHIAGPLDPALLCVLDALAVVVVFFGRGHGGWCVAVLGALPTGRACETGARKEEG